MIDLEIGTIFLDPEGGLVVLAVPISNVSHALRLVASYTLLEGIANLLRNFPFGTLGAMHSVTCGLDFQDAPM